MDIRCRKTECKFNDRQTCKASEISISCKDICESFEETMQKQANLSKHIFDNKEKFASCRLAKNTAIKCENDCILAKENQCMANGITVNEINKKPCCVTYVKKG